VSFLREKRKKRERGGKNTPQR